jgi:hypothetical protein
MAMLSAAVPKWLKKGIRLKNGVEKRIKKKEKKSEHARL